MNLKRTLFTGLAAAGLMASIATPMASAQVVIEDGQNGGPGGSVTATVEVGTAGLFDAFFCAVGVGPTASTDLTTTTEPSAIANGAAEGALGICYEDTKNYRNAFNLDLSAGDFTSPTTVTDIAASNFTVAHTYNVASLNCCGPAVGDIGYFQNDAYVGQNAAGAAWAPGYSLNNPQTVHFGYNGTGTIISGGVVDVDLVIPAGTHTGIYTSNVTLTVIAGTQLKPTS